MSAPLTPAAAAAVIAAAADPAALSMPTIRATLTTAGFSAPRKLRRAALLGVLADAAATAAAALPAPDPAPAAGPPLPPTEGTRAPAAVTARRVNLARGTTKDRAGALAEIIGPAGPHVKGRGEKARPKGGRAPTDYRAVVLAVFRDAVTASPVRPGPLPDGATGHAVTRPGGHPGHVLTGPDAPRVAVVPSPSLSAATLIGYHVAPVDLSPDGKRETARPTALYAVTRPGKGDNPPRIVTFSGYPVADVAARVAALRVDGKRVRKTPWNAVDVPALCEREGITAAGAAVAGVISAMAAADAIQGSDGAAVSAMRDDLATARAAATADAAGGKVAGAPAGMNTGRDMAAGRIVRRYDGARKRTAAALDTVRGCVRIARRNPAAGKATRTRKGGKGGETAA